MSEKQKIGRLQSQLEDAIARASKAEAECTAQKLATKAAIAANHDAFEAAKDQAARLGRELLQVSGELATTREELELSRARAKRLDAELAAVMGEKCEHGITRRFCTALHSSKVKEA